MLCLLSYIPLASTSVKSFSARKKYVQYGSKDIEMFIQKYSSNNRSCKTSPENILFLEEKLVSSVTKRHGSPIIHFPFRLMKVAKNYTRWGPSKGKKREQKDEANKSDKMEARKYKSSVDKRQILRDNASSYRKLGPYPSWEVYLRSIARFAEKKKRHSIFQFRTKRSVSEGALVSAAIESTTGTYCATCRFFARKWVEGNDGVARIAEISFGTRDFSWSAVRTTLPRAATLLSGREVF